MISGIPTGKLWAVTVLILCFFVIPLIMIGICDLIKKHDRRKLNRDNPYCKTCTAVSELRDEKNYWYNEYIKAEQIIAMLTMGRGVDND